MDILWVIPYTPAKPRVTMRVEALSELYSFLHALPTLVVFFAHFSEYDAKSASKVKNTLAHFLEVKSHFTKMITFQKLSFAFKLQHFASDKQVFCSSYPPLPPFLCEKNYFPLLHGM